MRGSIQAIRINGDWKKAKRINNFNFEIEEEEGIDSLDENVAMSAASKFMEEVGMDFENLILVSSYGESHLIKANDSIMFLVKRL